jgi:hypothetical protein
MGLRKALASGALLAAAAMPFAANAAIKTDDLGEIWLTVWDPTGQTSYQQDLGINTTLSGFTSSTQVDLGAGFTTWLGGVTNTSLVQFAVFGTNQTAFTGNGIWTTSASNGLTAAADAEFTQVANWQTTLVTAAQTLNGASTDFAANVSSLATPTSNVQAYFGDPFKVGQLGGTSTFITSAGLGQNLFFYFLGSTFDGTTFTDAVAQLFAGTFNLDSAGAKLNYSVGAAPIPLPAGIWLLGSALLGLVGVARRKRELA